MSSGTPIQSLPYFSDVRLVDSEDPFFIEVLAPIESETLDAAVARAQIVTQAMIDAAIAPLLAGTPAELDTFLEAFNRFVAEETAAAALSALVATKVPSVSPALTGAPTAPTAATSTNTGQIATTAFVQSVAALVTGAAEARQVLASGLATGGGDLSQDRTITVPKATETQARAGTNDAVAMTPLQVRNALLEVLQAPGVLAGLLPTDQPASAGIPWLNNGILSIS